MTLEASFERVELPLEHPFTIARGTTESVESVVVRIESPAGPTGIGGASPSARYGETFDTVEAVLPDLLAVPERVGDPFELERIERQMDETVADNPAAKAAVDIALHDLIGKLTDQPLYRYLGLDPRDSVKTSYTIGIDDPAVMRERAEAVVAAGFDTLKVKIGGGRDVQTLDAIRQVAPDATIRVDANEAFSPREALETIDRIAGYDVEFVEQPVPAGDREGLRFVHERSPVPIAVDESLLRATDVPDVADRTDIVNLKLMKAGGIREAIRIVTTARAHGLEVMAGCMIESNASIAAAAHLAPLLDYADLDGSLLLQADPYDGVPFDDGVVDLSTLDRPGTGAVVRE
ncbi:MAG: dipeptide epimerase [Halodesulfurarchaeum sp.]